MSAVVLAGSVGAELVECFDDVRQLLPADPRNLQKLGAGQRGNRSDGRQIGLSERGAQCLAERKLLHRLRRIA